MTVEAGHMPQTVTSAADELLEEFGNLITQEDLDELVHDAFSARASSINNSSKEEQFDFLVEEHGPTYLRRILLDYTDGRGKQ